MEHGVFFIVFCLATRLVVAQEVVPLIAGNEDVVAAAEECPSGYTLAAGVCRKEVARKPLALCPPRASYEVRPPHSVRTRGFRQG